MKAFLFVMILMTPDGKLPPQQEPMDTMEACVARVAEMQTKMAAVNENFGFQTTCVQMSKKADPA
jgi:hypothetical protein